MAGASGSGGNSNTVTSVQQIPAYEQQASQQNQALAQSLGSQPYPQYQGALIQPQNATQQQGENLAIQSASNYQPQLQQAEGTTNGALNGAAFNTLLNTSGNQIANAMNPALFNNEIGASTNQVGQAMNASGVNAYSGAAAKQLQNGVAKAQGQQTNAAQQAQALTNPNAVGAYMNPFIQQALAPQISDLNLQLANQQQGINSQAAQAGAYGDARQGAAQGLQNYYGNQALNQLIGTGYNNAYTQALSALGQAQGTQLGAASQYGNVAQTGLGAAAQYGNLANTALGEQNTQLSGAQQLGNLAGLANQQQNTQLAGAQQYGNLAGLQNNQQQIQLAGGAQQAALANQLQGQALTGANAVYNAGQQQQTQQQQELNAAYQQYLNQVNWPYQMLNVQESALSNSPYNIATATTLPNANETAQGFGTLAGAAGLIGSMSGGGNNNIFGTAGNTGNNGITH